MADLLELLGTLFQFVAFALLSALCGSILFLALLWIPDFFHAIRRKRSLHHDVLPTSLHGTKVA